MLIRMLNPGDLDRLSEFSCVMKPPRGWELAIDEAVRSWLPNALSGGDMSIAGGFDDNGGLDAVAAWQPVIPLQDTWSCGFVGVRIGRQRHGLGRQMKTHVLELARSAGIRFVVSVVHRDNKSMIALNEKLGAIVMPLRDDPRREHYSCIIEVL